MRYAPTLSALLTALAITAAGATAASAADKLGTLPGSVETITYADGHQDRGAAPEAYGFAPGTPTTIWSAYAEDAVAIDVVADLPALPQYGGGGHYVVHRTRDLATGATHAETTQEQRDLGVVTHAVEDCDAAGACRTHATTTPLAGAAAKAARARAGKGARAGTPRRHGKAARRR